MTLEAIRDTARGYAWLARTAMRGFGGHVGVRRRHLLLLAWWFPPMISGGVYRSAALARYAVKRGWRVSVICGPHPPSVNEAGRYMLDYVGPGVRMLRVSPGSLIPSYRFFPRVDGGFLNALQTVDLALDALADDAPGVILASGPPFHNFIAARFISRATGVPYLLDYRDEWTECPFSFVQKGYADRYYERACVRRAKRVIFTTDSHLDHQTAVFPQLDRERCVVIPNGWEPSDLEGMLDGDPPLSPAALHIAFVGALADHTLPAVFFSTLAKLLDRSPELGKRLRVSFVGAKSGRACKQLADFPYRDVLELIDGVPKPAALKIMRSADALLIINDTTLHRYRPGKLYDYLATEIPVLVYGEGGEVAELVRRFDAGYVVRAGDPEGLSDALASLKGLRGRSAARGVREWLAQHSREQLAKSMIDLLEEVLGTG